MGIVSRLVERRSSLSAPSDSLREALGVMPTEAGVVVNERTAMQMIAVYSCIRVLGESIASLPLPVYERTGSRGRERATGHPLYELLHDAPNPEMNSFTYWETVVAHLSAWGNHYSEVVRADGLPAALWPLPPNQVQVRRNERGDLEYVYNGGEKTFRKDQIFAIPLLGFNGLQGFSPIGMARRGIGVGLAAEQYGARFFEADARPSLVLSHPGQLSDVARQNLERSWQEGYGGVSRSWRMKVLEEGMSISSVGIPPRDAQFLELRRFQVAEIARLYRVPPHLIADVERSTSWGTGIEQQNIGLVIYTLRPYLVRIERAIRQQLIPPSMRERYYAEFLVDGLLRGDLTTRTQSYAVGRQWGWWSVNDIRAMENRNPVEGGDVYLQPLNMIDATADGDSPAPADDPARSAGLLETRNARREEREERSATARRRLANAHRAAYRDVSARILRMEQADIQTAVKRELLGRDVASFRAWVGEYYHAPDSKLRSRFAEYWTPVVTTLVGAVSGEAADELDADAPDDEAVAEFARSYVRVFANRHCGDSRARLLARINEDGETERSRRDAESLAEVIADEISDWPDRADREAEDEAHRSGNAGAVWTYGLLGVLALRWRTTGFDPCDYCQGMDGRRVSIGAPFLQKDEPFSPGDVLPLISRSAIGHPPLHDGCQCVITPVL